MGATQLTACCQRNLANILEVAVKEGSGCVRKLVLQVYTYISLSSVQQKLIQPEIIAGNQQHCWLLLSLNPTQAAKPRETTIKLLCFNATRCSLLDISDLGFNLELF